MNIILSKNCCKNKNHFVVGSFNVDIINKDNNGEAFSSVFFELECYSTKNINENWSEGMSVSDPNIAAETLTN